MSQTKKRDDPSTTSAAYDEMLPKWAKITTLLDGTESMRAAGQDMMPQHPEESDVGYNERIETTTLFNMAEITLNSWVGRVFKEPIKKNDDIPENILDHTTDIDLQGNDLGVFAHDVFKDGLSKGFTHILVDFPRPRDTEAEEGRPRTLADDVSEGLRPYWVHIKPENLIAARSQVINGKETLTHVRILEEVTEPDGFAEVQKIRIREINAGFQLPDGTSTPATVQIWERVRSKRGGKVKWAVVEAWEMGISSIPLVTFYAQRAGFMLSKPPILDLVNINITHWQSSSDQRNILTVSRFPMLAVSGAIDDENKIVVGPRKWLHIPDAQGRYYYVEHTGKAIGAGENDLRNLELQMAQYGAEFLKKRPDRESASARVLDSKESTSPLQDATVRFIDALNQALVFHGQWMSVDEPGTVTIMTDFGPDVNDSADLSALGQARTNRDLSRKRYLAEFLRRGVLADGFDEALNARELESEMAEFNDGNSETDLDPQGGDDDDEGEN